MRGLVHFGLVLSLFIGLIFQPTLLHAAKPPARKPYSILKQITPVRCVIAVAVGAILYGLNLIQPSAKAPETAAAASRNVPSRPADPDAIFDVDEIAHNRIPVSAADIARIKRWAELHPGKTLSTIVLTPDVYTVPALAERKADLMVIGAKGEATILLEGAPYGVKINGTISGIEDPSAFETGNIFHNLVALQRRLNTGTWSWAQEEALLLQKGVLLTFGLREFKRAWKDGLARQFASPDLIATVKALNASIELEGVAFQKFLDTPDGVWLQLNSADVAKIQNSFWKIYSANLSGMAEFELPTDVLANQYAKNKAVLREIVFGLRSSRAAANILEEVTARNARTYVVAGGIHMPALYRYFLELSAKSGVPIDIKGDYRATSGAVLFLNGQGLFPKLQAELLKIPQE